MQTKEIKILFEDGISKIVPINIDLENDIIYECFEDIELAKNMLNPYRTDKINLSALDYELGFKPESRESLKCMAPKDIISMMFL